MTPETKTEAILRIIPLAFDPKRCHAALINALEAYCTGFTGDAARDVDRFESLLETDGIIHIGYGGAVRRLLCHIDIAEAPAAAELTLGAGYIWPIVRC